MAANGAEGRCELCERTVSTLTKHHLIPRTRHKNKRNKKRFDRAEVRRRIAWLCRPCHKQIHSLLDEKQRALDKFEEALRMEPRFNEQPDLLEKLENLRRELQ